MNLVYTVGGNKNQRELVSDVAYFCIDKLMPRMKTLDVEIQINNLKNNTAGYCMMADDNRTFELEVNKKLDIVEMITTVCHEMVHVKQYARNELGIKISPDTIWKSPSKRSHKAGALAVVNALFVMWAKPVIFY